MTVSNPPQSRGHVEAGGDTSSPPAPRRQESPRSSQPTDGEAASPATVTVAASSSTASEAAAANSTTETGTEVNNEIVVGEGSEPAPDPEVLIAAFPMAKLQKLEELIHNPRWVIPVLPKGELEVLLETSISLAKVKADKRCEPCMRFYREGLLVSFTRIMTDEAVSSWRLDIHKCILRNCERLIELCVLKLDDEWFPMLDLLALVLNPTNKFHIYNASRHPEFPIDEPFAR